MTSLNQTHSSAEVKENFTQARAGLHQTNTVGSSQSGEEERMEKKDYLKEVISKKGQKQNCENEVQYLNRLMITNTI